MNDRHLKYILTIAEEGSITSAAQKLFISQPSLSALLSKVEHELGAVLFDRTGSRVTLTLAGECYVRAAASILKINEDMLRQVEALSSSKASILTIGCGRQLSTFLFPLILPEFSNKHPGVSIRLHEEKLSVLHQMICAGDLDIAFTFSLLKNTAMRSVQIFEEEVVLIAPTSFDIPAVEDSARRFPVVDLKDISDLPFALLSSGNWLRDIADTMFSDHNIKPDILLQSDNWQTCLGMVDRAEACTILSYSPLFSSVATDQLRRYSVKGSYFRPVYMYYRDTGSRDSAIANFVEIVTRVVQDIT